MDLQSLVEAALVYATSIDHTWSFIFTVIFAAVGFLATLRQVFSAEHRASPRYRRLILWVQMGMLVFMANGVWALKDLFDRHNAVLTAIQARATAAGEDPALVAAFQPYAVRPDWLQDCPADPAFLCDLNLPLSVLIFAVGALVLLLLMPLIAGRERPSA
ncbi:MAG: hypothetical protein AAF909_07715 [Pseudomonadota bacterium]